MALEKKPDVVVAGHLCLDIIPSIERKVEAFDQLIGPGKLANVGQAVMSTGGAVSNTGLALHKLGVATRLVGKIGDDVFGKAVLGILKAANGAPTGGIVVDPSVDTSYTIVVSPPGLDRAFLHCPGANDLFSADDVPYDRLRTAKLFHFGYPPLMRGMFLDNGAQLADMYAKARKTGATTSLDMALPDPAAESGKQDWVTILERALPNVDVFLPSFDEILFMLRPVFSASQMDSATAGRGATGKGAVLSLLSERLLAMGPSIVVLKLGDEGVYVRTDADSRKIAAMGRCAPAGSERWVGREFIMPCFRVNVAGTVGAGDCTIAGFLAAMLHGFDIERSAETAVGVGAFNVERPDATSGVPTWQVLLDRISSGWQHAATPHPGPGWTTRGGSVVWYGPNDSR